MAISKSLVLFILMIVKKTCEKKINYSSEDNFLTSPISKSSSAQFAENCDYNEKWYKCLPYCPITCDNIISDCVRKTSQCRSGCDCKSGFARLDPRGECFQVLKCFEYTDNKKWNTYQWNGNKVVPLKTGTISYLSYLYLIGVAIELTESDEEDNSCLENEVWQNESHCEEDCNNFRCQIRFPNRCYCRRGFVRDLNSARCIKRRDCPQICPTNEEFKNCGYKDVEECEGSLKNMNSRKSCTTGCFCKYGFSRIDGKCQISSKCPCRCGKNEFNIGNRCVCKYGFVKKNEMCVCPNDQIEIDNKCENIIDCGHGVPSLNPSRREYKYQQSCICNPTFSFIDGKCTCPSGTILIKGRCEPLLNCIYGTLILEPKNCVNNCESQSCECIQGFEYMGNGVCKCNHEYNIPFPVGCTSDCSSRICFDCETESSHVFPPPPDELACDGGRIPIKPDQLCFCNPNYCRRTQNHPCEVFWD